MIEIKCNDKGIREKKYVFDIVFNEFLGIEYSLEINNEINSILIEGKGGGEIILNSFFFSSIEDYWGDAKSLPNLPLEILSIDKIPFAVDIDVKDIPVLYGEPSILRNNSEIICDIDIFGTIFFMLSRYEEIVINTTDIRGRFMANSSIAYQAGFLLRPIVNEYLEILWRMLFLLDSRLERKTRKFKTILTCDVDWPFNPMNQSISNFLKQLAKDLMREKKLNLFFSHLVEYFRSNLLGWKYDSHNTFNYLMSLAESNKIEMAFYFICDNTAGKIDGNYQMTDTRIEKLIKEIHDRGHQVGMHGSYNTFQDKNQLLKEYGILTKTLKKLGIIQGIIGSRQHYLRYKTSETIRYLDAIGLSFDTSLSYADHAGFRSGTCYEYTMYDVEKRRKLSIKERPLIAMEASVISSSYMNMGYTDEALDIFLSLRKECQKYHGDFVILWHNSFFKSEGDKKILESILS